MELNKLIDYYFENAENPKLHTSKMLNTDTYRALQELRTLRKAYELICDSYVHDTGECNCPKEVRERCNAQDIMIKHCLLDSITAVKDYFFKEAQNELHQHNTDT